MPLIWILSHSFFYSFILLFFYSFILLFFYSFILLFFYSFIPLVWLFISFVFNFLVGGLGVVFEWFLCFWIFRTDLKENFFHQASFLKKPKNFLNTSLGSNVSHTLHPYMPIKITSQLTYTQLIKNHKIETLP